MQLGPSTTFKTEIEQDLEICDWKMASIATSLSRALPKPKYTGEHEDLPTHAQSKGPRILGVGSLDETQLVIKVALNDSSLQVWYTD